MPQRASDVNNAVKQLFTETGTNSDGLPLRYLLALDDALQRHCGALVDNLAKLQQLDTDIANAKHELDGEEAAADPAKKSRIEQLLSRLHNERAARLEGASANRDALRTQFSRIRETIARIFNEDTSLAERLHTLFREQGVTIASLLTALGFIISTVVLSIQNTLGGKIPAPGPTIPTEHGVAEWVKKQLKTLAGWPKALAGKVAAALPGIIAAIVSWLLKTAGVVATWLAEHLWAFAIALVAMATVWLRGHHYRKNR